MKKELQDSLYSKYPRIFAQKYRPPNVTHMCWGVCTGDGWYNIISALCQSIQQHLDSHNGDGGFEYRKKHHSDSHTAVRQVEAVQVKEKFGGLRFYYIGGNDHIRGMINMAEALSCVTCEDCGNPGIQSGPGWIRTLCEPCRTIHNKARADRFGDIQ